MRLMAANEQRVDHIRVSRQVKPWSVCVCVCVCVCVSSWKRTDKCSRISQISAPSARWCLTSSTTYSKATVQSGLL